MSSPLERALSDEELVELDEFLLSDACDEGTLSVDEVHGFITALTVAAELPPPEQWLEAIWGTPEFDDGGQQQRLAGLLLRMQEEIEATLAGAARPFEPLVVEEEEEDGEVFETYDGWCYGFMVGVDQQPEVWERLPKEQQTLIMPMAQIAVAAGEEEADMDEEEYAAWVELIGGAVQGLYGWFHRRH